MDLTGPNQPPRENGSAGHVDATSVAVHNDATGDLGLPSVAQSRPAGDDVVFDEFFDEPAYRADFATHASFPLSGPDNTLLRDSGINDTPMRDRSGPLHGDFAGPNCRRKELDFFSELDKDMAHGDLGDSRHGGSEQQQSTDDSKARKAPSDQPHGQLHGYTHVSGELSNQHELEDDEEDDEDDDLEQDRQLFAAAHEAYFTGNLWEDACIPLSPLSPPDDLADPLGCENIEALLAKDELHHNFKEKWDVDRESAGFLAGIMMSVKAAESGRTLYGLRPRFQDLKLDEPVLASDPEADMKERLERSVVHLTGEGITQIKLNDDKDESLNWPSKVYDLPVQFSQAVEKWEMSAETASYMKEVVEELYGSLQDWLDEDRKRSIIRRVSSPILPLSPPLSPDRLASPAANMELTSEPEDPSIREAADLEARIAKGDDRELEQAMQLHTDSVKSLLSNATTGSSSPLQRKAKRLNDLKVTSPLVPGESPGPPTKKAKIVSLFTEELQIVPMPLSEGDSTDPEAAIGEAMEAVADVLGPLAEPALTRMNDEQLIEADTTMRVPIPAVDDIKPTPPWETYSGKHRALLCDVRAEIVYVEKKWGGLSKVEKMLPWSPFPSHLGKLKLEGDFDDGSCARYLAELDFEGDVNLDALTWKPGGSLLLAEDEDDGDELEYADVYGEEDEVHESGEEPPGQTGPTSALIVRDSGARIPSAIDLPANPTKVGDIALDPQLEPRREDSIPSFSEMIRQKKIQIESEKHTRKVKAPQGQSVSMDATGQSNLTQHQNAGNNEQPSGGAMEHFGQFLALHGRTFDQAQQPDPDATPATPTSMATLLARATKDHPVAVSAPPKPKISIPLPHIDAGKGPQSIIVSSALMNNYHLVRKFQAYLPALEIIVRENLAQSGPQLGKQNGGAADLEADITLSPSTGLIRTNVQRLNQKALPGQASFLGIRDQIFALAPRYERLFVLVSEGRKISEDGGAEIEALGDHTAASLNDFTKQASGHHPEVQPIYIPGGDEELIKWIAATISRFACSTSACSLLHEETWWERFLRRAGLNAFAAQVVLSKLKPSELFPDGDGSAVSHSEVSGLAAFVMMDEEERIQRFGPLLGGQKVLRRVSKVIDSKWVSAANMR